MAFKLYEGRVADVVELAKYAYDHGEDREEDETVEDFGELDVEHLLLAIPILSKHKEYSAYWRRLENPQLTSGVSLHNFTKAIHTSFPREIRDQIYTGLFDKVTTEQMVLSAGPSLAQYTNCGGLLRKDDLDIGAIDLIDPSKIAGYFAPPLHAGKISARFHLQLDTVTECHVPEYLYYHSTTEIHKDRYHVLRPPMRVLVPVWKALKPVCDAMEDISRRGQANLNIKIGDGKVCQFGAGIKWTIDAWVEDLFRSDEEASDQLVVMELGITDVINKRQAGKVPGRGMGMGFFSKH
ncbi:hypothetical protein EJ02DRAFT_434235 [Clathrospora elynae]|uniref:Uncharacterized protein n=1 Tax=Clathrospora elynae TaxID=706981 RepID=A0A6A5SR49_9PLEO|nr:hypothetical protein EJ02DRAFT_434235 [Clathrospora elynae]